MGINGSADKLLDVHEERISRLEEKFEDYSTELTKTSVQLNHLSDQVASAVATLTQKIDSIVEPVSSQLKKQEEKIANLECDAKRGRQRNRILKRIFLAVAVAMSGAFGKYLFDLIAK